MIPNRVLNSSLNQSVIHKTIGELQNEHNEQGQSFIDKYQQCISTGNTIQIDKNCANCNGGFAQSIISHIKLACLSYVN